MGVNATPVIREVAIMCLACAAQGLSASWATYDHELTWLSGSGLIQNASSEQDPYALVPLAASGTTTSPTGTTTTDAVLSGSMWTGVVPGRPIVNGADRSTGGRSSPSSSRKPVVVRSIGVGASFTGGSDSSCGGKEGAMLAGIRGLP